MDESRFDLFTKRLAATTSRRGAMRLFGGALSATLLGFRGGVARAGGGNSDCAHFCTAAYPPGPERGQCISDGAHGVGACIDCGGDINRFCHGVCVDLTTIDHCGACDIACTSPDSCHTPVCTNGVCGTTTTVEFSTDVNNCGTCGTICHDDDCNDANCTSGACGKTPANEGALCDNNAGTCASGTCDESCTPNGGACSGPSGTCCSTYCEHASGAVDTTPGICKPCSPVGTPCNGLHCCNGSNCFHASGNINDAGICCKTQGDSCSATSDCCSGYCDGSYCRGGPY